MSFDPSMQPRGPTRFAFDPAVFFLTDPVRGLDYTLIAVGEKLSGPKRLDQFGWCALSNASDKHALGEVANIVQHPDGRYKEVVLRENRLAARLDLVLHYVADTEPGSSGSPVFNNEWEVIALHHWGGPWRQSADGHVLDREVNEGIRISAIVNDLRAKGATTTGEARALLQRLIQLGEAREIPVHNGTNETEPGPAWRVSPDGTMSWRIPIELSVRLPALMGSPPADRQQRQTSPQAVSEPFAEARVRPNQNYDNRSGYKPRFIEGHTIDLPQLTSAQRQDAARNRERRPGDDSYELKYHHFSIVMNRVRRLAFFTACNIDGANAKHVDRDTGEVTSLRADDDRLESLWAASEAAEASETWYDDPRLDPAEYAGRDIYQGQTVPGFADPRSMGHTLRMFQRGHLVRRMDPAWGSDDLALQADADTFHWTNCSPQVGFFNMGRANPRLRVPAAANCGEQSRTTCSGTLSPIRCGSRPSQAPCLATTTARSAAFKCRTSFGKLLPGKSAENLNRSRCSPTNGPSSRSGRKRSRAARPMAIRTNSTRCRISSAPSQRSSG
jgi:endonuclease G